MSKPITLESLEKRSNEELKAIIKALSLFPALNSKEETERLVLAKKVLQVRNKKAKEIKKCC